MILFEFATANRIIFGSGTLFDVGQIASELGQQALVVTGSSALRASPLFEILKQHQVSYAPFTVIGEPTVELVRQGLARAQTKRCELVIGFGGGSVLDTAKAIAVLLTNGGDPLDYLEVIGGGQSITRPAAP